MTILEHIDSEMKRIYKLDGAELEKEYIQLQQAVDDRLERLMKERRTMTRIDREFTKDIACPYCGALCIDSFDDEIVGGEIEYCPACHGEFKIERHIKLMYSTHKLESEESNE